MQRFTDKVVLVTGGTAGIGLATAKLFAARKATVVIVGRQEAQGQEAVFAIEAQGGDAHYIQADLKDANAPKMIVDSILDTYGRLDCAYNNAAMEGHLLPIHEQSEEMFDDLIAVNLKAVWLCMKYEIQAMLESGNGGSIVNCSSIGSKVTAPGLNLYSATKAAVNALTRSAAVEYASQGISVNAVCPATIKTPMVERLFQDNEEIENAVLAKHPIGRFGTPEEVAELVVWLSTQSCPFLVGEAINIDGGLVNQ